MEPPKLLRKLYRKGTRKVRTITCHEHKEGEQRNISTLSLTPNPRPGHFTPGMTQYPLYWRQGGRKCYTTHIIYECGLGSRNTNWWPHADGWPRVATDDLHQRFAIVAPASKIRASSMLLLLAVRKMALEYSPTASVCRLSKTAFTLRMHHERQSTYNVTLRRVSVTIFAVEKQCVLHILSACL
jgi:hypothetical protein